MRSGDIEEALELNRRIVGENRGAGRLWASLIQIIHQYCSNALVIIGIAVPTWPSLYFSLLFSLLPNRVKYGVKEEEFFSILVLPYSLFEMQRNA